MRIVSLLPAATEMVAALGATDWLVGVSHACDFPPEVLALPRVTRSLIDTTLPSGRIHEAVAEAARRGGASVEVDVQRVAQLRPDVLIGQSVCDVCAVGQQDLARVVTALIPVPWVLTLHAHTLDGVLADIGRVGEVLELRDEADELVAGLRYRLRRVAERGAAEGATRPKPRVVVLEWLDPPYVAGHWVPELVALAGGEDVAATPGEPSRVHRWTELIALDPDVVVVALCGFDVARAEIELGAARVGEARAVLARRVAVIDGNAYTSRPGPRLVDAAEHLVRALHS